MVTLPETRGTCWSLALLVFEKIAKNGWEGLESVLGGGCPILMIVLTKWSRDVWISGCVLKFVKKTVLGLICQDDDCRLERSQPIQVRFPF